MTDHPTLTVLIYSSLAAATAGVGILPLALRGRVALSAVGWANALAAGLMLGVAYTLLTTGLREGLVAGGMGALLGIGFVGGTHAVTGTGELDTQHHDTRHGHSQKLLLADALHAAHEGVAIGVAMALSLPLGIAMAATLAVHNVPEALILARVLIGRGMALRRAASLAVATNVNQILLAVATFTVAGAVPALLPWATGFSVGALLYLVLVELLPESYLQAGHTSIGLVTLIAMGMVVLLGGVL